MLINGLIEGAAIALLAMAFQIVYLPTRVFYIGLAGIYSATPFIAYAVIGSGGSMWGAALLAMAAAVGVAVLSEWGSHARLARRHASEAAQMIASLGSYIILVQVVALVWGSDPKALRQSIDHVTHFGGIAVTGAQWATFIVSVLLLSGFGVILMRTDMGLRLRALADNPTRFALLGYDVSYYRLLAFIACGVFAAAASLVTAFDLGFDPYTGLHAFLLAVVAVIIGGRGTFLGPVVGGVVLGVLRAEVVWYLSARWQEAVTFALLAVMLLLRPQGLLGKKSRLEATQ